MGNSSRPGTVVVREIDHERFTVNGVVYFVRELVWNGIAGRSYDLVALQDGTVFTEDESLDEHPSRERIADILEAHGIHVPVDFRN